MFCVLIETVLLSTLKKCSIFLLPTTYVLVEKIGKCLRVTHSLLNAFMYICFMEGRRKDNLL